MDYADNKMWAEILMYRIDTCMNNCIRDALRLLTRLDNNGNDCANDLTTTEIKRQAYLCFNKALDFHRMIKGSIRVSNNSIIFTNSEINNLIYRNLIKANAFLINAVGKERLEAEYYRKFLNVYEDLGAMDIFGSNNLIENQLNVLSVIGSYDVLYKKTNSHVEKKKCCEEIIKICNLVIKKGIFLRESCDLSSKQFFKIVDRAATVLKKDFSDNKSKTEQVKTKSCFCLTGK